MRSEKISSGKGFTAVLRLSIFLYFASLGFSQWYFAGIEEGTLTPIIPKNLTSILVISIGLALVTSVDRLAHHVNDGAKNAHDFLVFATFAFLFSTFTSIVIGVWRSGLNIDAVEGVKSMAATLCGLIFIRHFSSDLSFAIRCFSFMFGVVVVFSMIQLSVGINWQTKNSFFTVGALTRWWDLNSAWGPYALSGKNSFGVILVLSFSFLAPILILSNYFAAFHRILLGAVLVCVVILVFLSRSRTSIILLSMNLLILLMFYSAKRKNYLPFALITIMVPVIAYYYIARNTGWILSNQSAIARSYSLAAATLSPDSNYLFGTGYNSIFQLTASTFGNSLSQAGTRGINVDNYFLRRILESGLLGFLSFIAIIFALASNFVKGRKLGSDGELWGLCSLLLLIDISIASATGDFLSFQLVNCYFFVIVGFIVSGFRKVRS